MGNSLRERTIYEKELDIDTILYILVGIRNMSYDGNNNISRGKVLSYLNDLIYRLKYKYKKKLKPFLKWATKSFYLKRNVK